MPSLPALALLIATAAARPAEVPAPDGDAPKGPTDLALRPEVEAGFLGVLSHGLQQDSGGTWFDLKRDGGQGTLFPFFRLAADLRLARRHHVDLVMQPLDLRTEVHLQEDLVVDQATFPADSAVDIRYGFDFYRASYRYDLLPSPRSELSVGGGLQLRDADILFTSADGAVRRENRDVGPVPLLAVQGERRFRDGTWLGAELSGFYANIKVLNGSTRTSVEGAIYDAALKVGFDVHGPVDSWLNLRALGGGAEGTSQNPDGPGDGFTKNWLHTVTVSLGLALDAHQLGAPSSSAGAAPPPPPPPPPPPGEPRGPRP
ncbi:hypothetical protein L6R53_13855 [Myxococcota bacterium]|nr:hypothetical protein [Myxococcota bacterium]